MQAICTSLQKTTTPAPHHSDFYRLDALPDTKTNSIKAMKASRFAQKMVNNIMSVYLHDVCAAE